MAYSQDLWDSAKDYYETGKLTLEEIKAKTGISVSKISEKAKKEKWEKGRTSDYIDAKITLADKKGKEKGKTIQILEEVSHDEIKNRELVFGLTQTALKQLTKTAQQGTKQVLVKYKLGGNDIMEIRDMDLTPQDYQSIIESSDRASLTLKINDRHAPKVEVTQQNQTAIVVEIE